MTFSEKHKELTAKNILELINEADIYKQYMPSNFKFDVPFSSPFRVDKIPSFVIGSSRRHFRYKDFAMGDTGNCFTFVMQLYNINFNQALIQIVKDFNISHLFEINNNNYIINTSKAKFENPGKTLSIGEVTLKIKRKDFTQEDYDYWNSYGISPSYLKLGRIVAISYYFINDIPYKADKFAYAYIEKKDNITTYKIYQPYSKYKKWIAGGGKNNSSIWEMWHLLPEEGEELIITSSRKDALAIIENLKMPSVSLQAESIIPKDIVLKAILKRFKRVYLFYDNDISKINNPGQTNAKKLLDKYPELINIVIPDNFNSKDFSDLILKYGRSQAKEILKQIINDKI